MAISTQKAKDGSLIIIEAPERLDASASGEFRGILRSAVEQGIFDIVIDLSKTQTVDSTGLGAMVSRIATARAQGGDVRLAGVQAAVNKLLSITHLDQVFKSFPTVSDAVASFAE
jgi:anti-sigma B factor antagonist